MSPHLSQVLAATDAELVFHRRCSSGHENKYSKPLQLVHKHHPLGLREGERLPSFRRYLALKIIV